MKLYNKKSKCTEMIYATENDSNGYPMFLVRKENEWKWQSAKYFCPEEEVVDYIDYLFNYPKMEKDVTKFALENSDLLFGYGIDFNENSTYKELIDELAPISYWLSKPETDIEDKNNWRPLFEQLFGKINLNKTLEMLSKYCYYELDNK